MSKVELYATIRRDHRAGLTMRELERKPNVTWRTVRKALDSAWPEPRKPLPPRPSALDPYKAVIDGILRADLDAPAQAAAHGDSDLPPAGGGTRRRRVVSDGQALCR